MILTYSGKSAPSANAIALQGGFSLNRGNVGDINWGRYRANTRLNPDITNSTNKRVMRELFAEHSVPMPRLLTLEEAADLAEAGTTVVGRPDTHRQGRGFWKCESRGRVILATRGTRKKKAATHFMEYIDAPREYRVHIFKGKSIRISEKSFYDSYGGKLGSHAYETHKPQHNVKHVRKAAKKAVEALGLDFGAVDILANDTECWVLEVNAAPGLGGTMPQLYANTFHKWAKGER